MATVTFKLRNNTTEQATISVYCSVKRGKQFLVSTGLFINPNNWGYSTKLNKGEERKNLSGFPKNVSDEQIKKLRTNLTKLSAYLISEVNNANADGTIINSNWVREHIDICFDRKTDSEIEKQKVILNNNKLLSQVKAFIDNAPTYIHSQGKVGLSKNRIKSLNTFKGMIENYEKETKSVIYLNEVNFDFETKFNKWMLQTKGYGIEYSGSMIKDLKTICQYALKKGLNVSPNAKFISNYRKLKKDRVFQILTNEELDRIEKWETKIERLDNARKWILLGCNIGQRGSDLLDITLKNFVTIKGKQYIQLIQQKTGKEITIYISKNCERILKKGLPYKISQQKLNEYVKEVCELVGIDEVVEGDLYDKETKRKKRGNYPKYKLIGLHTFRRSYASNCYIDVPTPLIMEVTGHSKESTFLEYINKPLDTTRNANLMLELIEIAEKKRRQKKETAIIEINKAN